MKAVDSRQDFDLGDGVRVVLLPDGQWIVQSAVLDLPWRVRRGRVAGSAVLWKSQPWEVTLRVAARDGSRWTLGPWPETEPMRSVHTLDREWIEGLAKDRQRERTSSRLRWILLPALPVLGLVPGGLQHVWQRDWGFPAVAATALSAILELMVAAVGMIHLLASAFGGGAILPSSLGWVALVAPLLFIEAAVRLKHTMGHSEPIGSLVGLPLAVLVPQLAAVPQSDTPEVRLFDPDAGQLELDSPIYRNDWTTGSVLRYRDQPFELVKVERLVRSWRYRFERLDDEDAAPRLALLPARPPKTVAKADRGGLGLMRVAVTTALSCLALGPDQERWGAFIGVRPVLLTMIGSGAEVVGAIANLRFGPAASSPLTLLLNVCVLAEGLYRCARLLTGGRPVGSLIGYAIHPWMKRAIERTQYSEPGGRISTWGRDM